MPSLTAGEARLTRSVHVTLQVIIELTHKPTCPSFVSSEAETLLSLMYGSTQSSLAVSSNDSCGNLFELKTGKQGWLERTRGGSALGSTASLDVGETGEASHVSLSLVWRLHLMLRILFKCIICLAFQYKVFFVMFGKKPAVQFRNFSQYADLF